MSIVNIHSSASHLEGECKSLDRSITENKEKKSDTSIDESTQAERQRGRALKQGIGRICMKLAKTTEVTKCFDIRLVA